MEVYCEGCAGCCMDWRSGFEDGVDERGALHRRRPFDADDARAPLDGDRNFVPLSRDEIRAFLEAGLAAALTPRFWRARDEREGVEIGGFSVASVADRPVFFVGLRKPPKPVAPFGLEEPRWLPTCIFLDPTTLQCRVHGGEFFPDECGAYPAHTLALEGETECERVERAFGGERLLDSNVPDDLDGLLLGAQSLGAKLFAHPRPDALEGLVDRLATDPATLAPADRAECLAVAVASSPGTLALSEHHYEWGKEVALETLENGRDENNDIAAPGSIDGDEEDTSGREGSWIEPAIREWHRRRREAEGAVPSPSTAVTVEDRRGAPGTPGWDALEEASDE